MIPLESLGLWENTKTMTVILSNFIRPAVKKMQDIRLDIQYGHNNNNKI